MPHAVTIMMVNPNANSHQEQGIAWLKKGNCFAFAVSVDTYAKFCFVLSLPALGYTELIDSVIMQASLSLDI